MSKFIDQVLLDEAKKRGQIKPISKSELAELREVTPATISNYYSGKKVIPGDWFYWAAERYGWNKKRLGELVIAHFEK